MVTTKRVVLSFLARLFDPLEFISLFVMIVKILVQDIWRLGHDWDMPVPQRFIIRLCNGFKVDVISVLTGSL